MTPALSEMADAVLEAEARSPDTKNELGMKFTEQFLRTLYEAIHQASLTKSKPSPDLTPPRDIDDE